MKEEKIKLQIWVYNAIRKLGGRATLVEVARVIWDEHEADLRAFGDLFYTWQYDMRWAATALRHAGKIKAAEESPRGIWELV